MTWHPLNGGNVCFLITSFSEVKALFSPALCPSSLKGVWRSQRLLEDCCTFDSSFFEALIGRLSANVTRLLGLAGVGDWSQKAWEKALRNECRAIHKINGQRGMDLPVAVETASEHKVVSETEWDGKVGMCESDCYQRTFKKIMFLTNQSSGKHILPRHYLTKA